MRESQRASWWITFVLLASLGGAWALASPPTAAPDERDHIVTASAVARGQLIGDELSASMKAQIRSGNAKPSAYTTVDVAELYEDADPCFAGQRELTANCLHLAGSSKIGPVTTPVGWYPPAYYAYVGLLTRPFAPGGTTAALMRLATVILMAALLASAIASLRRSPSSRLRIIGFLTSLTPMVLFMNASVNPNGPEIAAGLALWASGAVLIRELELGGTVDRRLATRVGIAATVLALARQDSPLWLGLIVLTLAVVAGWTRIRAMWSSGVLRAWGAVVIVCTIAQVAWVLVVGTLSAEHSVFAPLDLKSSEAARQAIGRTFEWYHQIIGYFGFLDTPSPRLTVMVWTIVIGGLVLFALGVGDRRWAIAAIVVLAGTLLLPIIAEYAQAEGFGTGRWQGRYVLPFAVGVPILAAFAIERDELTERMSSSILPAAVGVALAVGQIAAFAQNLRRYTVGYNGDVWFFLHPVWSPPLGAAALFAGYVVAIVVTFTWLLAPDRSIAAPPAVPVDDEVLVPS